jgi:signal transduction histidine kinase
LRTVLEPDPFPVSVDPDQLRQVLGNLLTNSVQAMDGKGQITIAGAGAGDYDVIRIQDGGPGISPEHRARAFEPLFSTKAKGTGLGLTICRQIIEQHGGTIEWVEADGAGATLQIRLPRLGAPKVLVGPEDYNDCANRHAD